MSTNPTLEDNEKTTEQADNYLKRFRMYDTKAKKWIPYDPSTFVPKVAYKREDTTNYFYLDVRYEKPGKVGQLVLNSYSQTLLVFLRKEIGQDFFDKNPITVVSFFFPHLKNFTAILDEARSWLDILRSEEKKKLDSHKCAAFIKKLGEKKFSKSTPKSEKEQRIADFVEHFSVFVDFIAEQFQPTLDRLELVRSYGHIHFDLLQYYFVAGLEVVCGSGAEDNPPLAFVVKSSSYHTSDRGKYFTLHGTYVFWGGSRYDNASIQRNVDEFSGSRQLSELPFTVITPEEKLQLQERGRLYTGLSGIHYRTYNGQRIVIDINAYNQQSGYTRDPDQIIPTLAEDKLHLLPPRVFGYNLSKKSWGAFLVEKVRPVQFDEGAWDHLVLDADVKTLIKGLVDVTKNANSGTNKIIKDVISGKGGGLIAVLHGSPGTGKTLTAEAVAENLKRPLYMVGSSELPSTPAKLETSLQTILSLATAWDAVLLIDEADVYLEQRSLHELERNAIVSVALRILEYHRGVLFLTTNRIKSFDEAFLSRFSIAIKFKNLDAPGRYIVWKKFFELAGSKIDDGQVEDDRGLSVITHAQIEDLSQKNLNGRTIKNIVRTAQALALSEGVPMNIAHVTVVLRAQERFLEEFTS